jgi:beta-aspartyl-dipeptidase (metallo-type)
MEQGLPQSLLTISSDGGGCLPNFDKAGNMTSMDFANSLSMTQVFYDLLDAGYDIETFLPFFTSNVAALMKFHRKGRIACGLDADLLVLDKTNRINHVMAQGRWHVFNTEIIKKGLFE